MNEFLEMRERARIFGMIAHCESLPHQFYSLKSISVNVLILILTNRPQQCQATLPKCMLNKYADK